MVALWFMVFPGFPMVLLWFRSPPGVPPGEPLAGSGLHEALRCQLPREKEHHRAPDAWRTPMDRWMPDGYGYKIWL